MQRSKLIRPYLDGRDDWLTSRHYIDSLRRQRRQLLIVVEILAAALAAAILWGALK